MLSIKYPNPKRLEADREVENLLQILFQTGLVIFNSYTAYDCKISNIKDFKPDFRVS